MESPSVRVFKHRQATTSGGDLLCHRDITTTPPPLPISSCRSIAIITIIVFKLVAARGNINLASGTHFSRVSS
ncbi:hypothetical protein AHAS_Ahas01G0162200 [Arachis hypogaea]